MQKNKYAAHVRAQDKSHQNHLTYIQEAAARHGGKAPLSRALGHHKTYLTIILARDHRQRNLSRIRRLAEEIRAYETGQSGG